MEIKKGFFAYSSEPKYCGEFIEEAIRKINESSIVKITSWKELGISGNFIIGKILNQIIKSDFFCADLTGMNENVIFELGFAIAKGKPIFLILDTSHTDSTRRFKEFNLLTTVGYKNYHNSPDIINSFFEERPFEQKSNLINNISPKTNSTEKALFYLKGQVDTNYSQEILNIIESKKLPCTVDDPIESKTQPLTWYLDQLSSVPALLSELSSMHRSGHELHNSKCSLISGLALGFDLKVLMVAEKPYPESLDYQELLRKYTNRQSCKEAVEPFISRLKDDIAQLLFERRSEHAVLKERSNLQKINFGEYIAEHENKNIYEYYIETSHPENLIKNEHNIVIGRKGTGKTATFYFINEELSRDVRNQVCLIKPINFEIDGLVTLIKGLNNEFEKGYMIEAIWKFLIYTEIAKSLYLKIKEKPIYSVTSAENDLMSFIENNKIIILSDFSTRLEQEIELLKQANASASQNDFRIKISEILHDNILTPLKTHFRNVLLKNKKLIVLIDNLDKSWRAGNDIEILSRFLLGLLGIVGRISVELKGKPQDNVEYSFHLILFLRSDIFKYVMKAAREPDKIEYSRLRWNDPEIFFRLIETRFKQLSNIEVVESDLWEKYISKEVLTTPVKKWILNKIIPRPRDIIYFFNMAKNFAVSRGHKIILESDLVSAYTDYSNWVFKSIIVENGITIKQMESFMYQLMGESVIISKDKIEELMMFSEMDFTDSDHFIDHLTSLSILGRETTNNVFEFEYEFDVDKKIKSLSAKFNSNRFKIHEAFVPYLECKG